MGEWWQQKSFMALFEMMWKFNHGLRTIVEQLELWQNIGAAADALTFYIKPNYAAYVSLHQEILVLTLLLYTKQAEKAGQIA